MTAHFDTMLEFSVHASIAARERNIPEGWIERVVSNPTLRCPEPRDSALERFYAAIPECDDRVLRVVVNTRVAPWRVVSVFFDRSMKGKL
jgi:hypothetical protein